MNHYTEVTQEAGRAFYMKFMNKGKVVMLNLLKFKEHADYTGFDSIRPLSSISGNDAYELYMKHTLPHLEQAGSRVLFRGNSSSFLIGPENEHWDLVLLVEHQSVEAFMAFAQNEEYLNTAGHRTAALLDSRLLPISEL